jgi:hypothetical protein
LHVEVKAGPCCGHLVTSITIFALDVGSPAFVCVKLTNTATTTLDNKPALCLCHEQQIGKFKQMKYSLYGSGLCLHKTSVEHQSGLQRNNPEEKQSNA